MTSDSENSNYERQVLVEKKKSSKDVPRIWKANPSYKDTNLTLTIARIIILASLCIFFVCSVYVLIPNISVAITVGLVILLVFIASFYEKIPSLFALFSRTHHIHPFKDIVFFMEHENAPTIYISHTKEQRHTGLKIFKIQVIPENVSANVDRFIKALSEYKNMVRFTYQIIQTPSLDDNSIKTYIYFCTYYAVSGSLNVHRYRKLREHLQKLEAVLKSNFVGNFHHYQILLLSGINLINALRTYFFRASTKPITPKTPNTHKGVEITLPFLIKATVLFILSLISFFLLSRFNLPFIVVIALTLLITVIIVVLWWREILFIISGRKVLIATITINPFFDTRFFKYQGISDTIFAYIDDSVLVGIKMYNLVFAFPPSYSRSDKFIQGIMNQKISFGYTCMGTPISYAQFYEKGKRL